MKVKLPFSFPATKTAVDPSAPPIIETIVFSFFSLLL